MEWSTHRVVRTTIWIACLTHLHDIITQLYQHFVCTHSLSYNITWKYIYNPRSGSWNILSLFIEETSKKNGKRKAFQCIHNITNSSRVRVNGRENKRKIGHWNTCMIHWITKLKRKSIHVRNKCKSFNNGKKLTKRYFNENFGWA